jgi:hypothetical protein
MDLEFVNPTEWCEPPADGFRQADLAITASAEGVSEDAPGLGLHRVSALSGTDAQSLLDGRIQVADRDAAHCDVVI